MIEIASATFLFVASAAVVSCASCGARQTLRSSSKAARDVATPRLYASTIKSGVWMRPSIMTCPNTCATNAGRGYGPFHGGADRVVPLWHIWS